MDDDERDVVAALRRGDEATFRRLIERYRPGMLWVARRYVRDRATAEEVVQETWLAVIQGNVTNRSAAMEPGSLRMAATLSPALCENRKLAELTWLYSTPWPASSCSTTR